MENTAKKATKKAADTTPSSIDKIAKAAKTINVEVTETANGIINDFVTEGKAVAEIASKSIKEVLTEGKQVREIAAKSAKEAAEKIHVKENVAKIKATAMEINRQIKETATEIMDDMMANRKELMANANKMAIEAIENVNITERVATLKTTVKNANDFAFETAESIVDGIAINSEKWQGVAQKAYKGGMKVAGRQQKIMASTFETVKGQLTDSATRLKNIFKNN